MGNPSIMRMLRILVAWVFVSPVWSLSCYDASRDRVDYFTALKYNTGAGYSIMFNNEMEFAESKHTLNTTEGAIYHTLSQVYTTSPRTTGYIFYNDQFPEGPKHGSRGHSKGVLAFNSKGGFWLTHSMPAWPPNITTGYKTLPSLIYAQSFLCVSFNDLEQIEKIGAHLKVVGPWVYESNLPESLREKLPNIASVISGKFTFSNATLMTGIHTSNKADIIAFAVGTRWEFDIYEDLMSFGLDDNLVVDTWQNGNGGKMNTTCKDEGFAYDTQNVERFIINGHSWDSSQDHSKWAVTTNGGTHSYVCIGDINRMDSQTKRSGGAVCVRNKYMAAQMLKGAAYENCTKNDLLEFD